MGTCYEGTKTVRARMLKMVGQGKRKREGLKARSLVKQEIRELRTTKRGCNG